MTDAFLMGALALTGWVVVITEIALSFWQPTRVFRVAVGAAAVGGVLGAAVSPFPPWVGFSSGAAVAGGLAGLVCAFIAVVEYVERGRKTAA